MRYSRSLDINGPKRRATFLNSMTEATLRQSLLKVGVELQTLEDELLTPCEMWSRISDLPANFL
ncbi:MAG: hypothetical protein DWH78_15335 [Planctomycetota bacterium]|nr:MAG: hypothetical protein DWH78_15335 [Planctomycetota bacterium]